MLHFAARKLGRVIVSAGAAAQLFVAADRVPFVGAALPRLALRRLKCQFGRHVKARGRLSERTLGRRELAHYGGFPHERCRLPNQMHWFPTIAPFLTNPLVLVGFALLLFYGLLRDGRRLLTRLRCSLVDPSGSLLFSCWLWRCNYPRTCKRIR